MSLDIPKLAATVCLGLAIAFAFSVGWLTQDRAVPASDLEFEKLILGFSESPGYFDTDNLISNESSYQHVIPILRELAEPGKAYIGVGPDQNYTYISHVLPGYAFIIDIRRDNLLLHLYFKQLLETCRTREEYLSSLLGRPVPAHSLGDTAISEFAAQFKLLHQDRQHFEQVFEEAWRKMRMRFPRLVSESDRAVVLSMAEGFYKDGLDLKFRSHWRSPRSIYPTLGDLLTETDLSGTQRCYLASESDYQFVRGLHLENRILPVIGDLSGEKALRKIGSFLRQREIPVSAFYVSNVEFYLLRQGRFAEYIRNVRSLPIGANSLIIRSHFDYWGEPHPEHVPGYFVTSIVQRLSRFLQYDREEPYRDYRDVAFRDFVSNRAAVSTRGR